MLQSRKEHSQLGLWSGGRQNKAGFKCVNIGKMFRVVWRTHKIKYISCLTETFQKEQIKDKTKDHHQQQLIQQSHLSHLLSNTYKSPSIPSIPIKWHSPSQSKHPHASPPPFLFLAQFWVHYSKARVLILLYSNPNQMEDRQPETILARRYNEVTKRHEYQVHWINYRLSEATWETRETLRDHMQMVEEFDAREDGADQQALRKPIRKKCTKRTPSTPREPLPPPTPPTPPVQRRGRGRPPKNAPKHGGPQSPISLDPSTPCREKPEEPQAVDHSDQPTPQATPEPLPPKRGRGRPRKIRPTEPSEEKKEKKEEKAEKKEKEPKRSKSRGNSKYEKVNHPCHEIFQNQLSHQDEESDFLVLEVRKGREGMVFVVEDHGKNKLITRSQLVKSHPMALLAFYEARIKLKDLPGGENIEDSSEEVEDDEEDEQEEEEEEEEEGSSVEEMEGPRRRYPFRRRK